jgi:hypothetical protein
VDQLSPNDQTSSLWGYNGGRAVSRRGDGTELAWGARWKAGDVIGVCAHVKRETIMNGEDQEQNEDASVAAAAKPVTQWVAKFSFSLNGDWQHPMGVAFERVVVGTSEGTAEDNYATAEDNYAERTANDNYANRVQMGIRPAFTIHEPTTQMTANNMPPPSPSPRARDVGATPPSQTPHVSSEAAPVSQRAG